MKVPGLLIAALIAGLAALIGSFVRRRRRAEKRMSKIAAGIVAGSPAKRRDRIPEGRPQAPEAIADGAERKVEVTAADTDRRAGGPAAASAPPSSPSDRRPVLGTASPASGKSGGPDTKIHRFLGPAFEASERQAPQAVEQAAAVESAPPAVPYRPIPEPPVPAAAPAEAAPAEHRRYDPKPDVPEPAPLAYPSEESDGWAHLSGAAADPMPEFAKADEAAQSVPHGAAAEAPMDRPPPPPERIIDAHLLAITFAPGEIASLTVTLRLPSSRALGQFEGRAAVFEAAGPVVVALEAKGFTLLSELPPPLTLVAGRDSAPAAFQLQIEESSERWLHITLVQDGQSVGELAINNFTSFAGEDRQISGPMHRVRDADLTLIVRAAEDKAIVCSPRDRASLEYQTIPGISQLATPFKAILRDRLRALYDATADAAATARELQIVGVQMAHCLSPQLTGLLRRPDVRTVMLRHDEDFDFPLELCFLDDPVDPFFVGDRIAVCRWYLGVTNPPDVTSKRVRRIAYLRGDAPASVPDEAMLNRLYPDRTTTLSTFDSVRDALFKTSDFDLIQFTGHCVVTDAGLGGLKLADGKFVRIVDIGQLLSERKFTDAQPFVLLNACASAQPYIGLTDRDSFAHRFVTAQACAFIGTLWPVDGTVANDFATAFHEALRTRTVGSALLAAKLAVIEQAAASAGAGPDIAAVARQVAARSYCLFAHPDLRLAA